VTTRYQQLRQAKRIIAADPSLTDVEVADVMGVPSRAVMLGRRNDVMSVIATARRDLETAASYEHPEGAA
jgi:hypothetical protein